MNKYIPNHVSNRVNEPQTHSLHQPSCCNLIFYAWYFASVHMNNTYKKGIESHLKAYLGSQSLSEAFAARRRKENFNVKQMWLNHEINWCGCH